MNVITFVSVTRPIIVINRPPRLRSNSKVIVKKESKICPRCHIAMPLTNICDNC